MTLVGNSSTWLEKALVRLFVVAVWLLRLLSVLWCAAAAAAAAAAVVFVAADDEDDTSRE